MDKEFVHQAIVELFIDEIVSHVSEKLLQLQKKALVVCTGSVLGFDQWMAGLKQLQEAGFTLDLFLSYGAVNVLNVDKMKQSKIFGNIWESDPGKAPEMLASEYPTIIVPALTVATASRIAQCTADTPASRMIFNSMMRGKNVIVVTDGCCPDNPKRAELGYHMTEPLKMKLRANLTALQEYGASLTSAEKVAEKTLRMIGTASFGKKEESPSFKESPAKQNPSGSQSVRISGRIVGRADIAALTPGSTLVAASDCQVTQLARDMARTKMIKIVQERK